MTFKLLTVTALNFIVGLSVGFAQTPVQLTDTPATTATAPANNQAAAKQTVQPVAQQATQELTDKFAKIREQFLLVGLAAVAVTPETNAPLVAVGYRTSREQHAVSANDQWHIGSITKSMTATLAAILVKEQKLSFDMQLQAVWPEMPMHDSYKTVTLMELLSHRSGLTEDIAKTTNWNQRFFDKRPITAQRSEWAQEILATTPEHARGEYAYSNAGFVVAGALMEKVTGQSWEALMQEKLFTPLGMTRSGFGAPSKEAPWGHQTSFFSTKPMDPNATDSIADNPAAMGPAGTVHVSLADMAQFIRLQLGQFPDVLTRAQLAPLQQADLSKGDYHGGFVHLRRGWAKGVALHHSGSNTFWYATIWIAPEVGLGFFTATNSAGMLAPKALDAATVELLNSVQSKPAK
ncbi:MAG: beta-lactamase family protein [Gammaproteobacteria bacterium]|nr:beta-lactamase family protein [Gammaproteobacteria bacterium]